MGRFAEHESIAAPVAIVERYLPWPAGSGASQSRGEAWTERRSHGLDHRPFVFSDITPILRPQQRPTGLGAKGLTLPQLAMPG